MNRPAGPERDERGAVAIIVALTMTTLLVVAAMVLDFGLVRIDRQIDRTVADAATLAGLHGLNTGDGAPHPNVGVCTAAQYLKVNNSRFSGANENAGWSNGLGAATGNGCTDTTLRNKICKATDKSTWAKWSWSGTSQGVTLQVTIENGYDLALPTNQYAEDALPATTGDNGGSAYQGCDNLAVTISQSRTPGLGSLATTSDLQTAIRSVGRFQVVPGDSAPAMLLLKRTGCPVLVAGSAGGGSKIQVFGAVATDGSGKTQPGTIHSDSNGVGCTGSNNGWIFGGRAADGIVAYAAPLASNQSTPDPSKPGSITAVAIVDGISGTPVRDTADNVYGSAALNGTGGTKVEVSGRSLVTRGLVDERYFPGIKPAISSASTMFTSGASGPPANGWDKVLSACNPTAAEVAAVNVGAGANTSLYVNCAGGFTGNTLDNGGITLNAGTIYFRGSVAPGANTAMRLPNAHHVYVGNHTNSADAITLSNGRSLQVNTAGNLNSTSGNCSTGQRPSKSVLFVRHGAFKQTAGLLRMCRTTTIMMSGRSDGCVPLTSGTAPSALPCAGAAGGGEYTQNGGDIDWTAPDTLDQTLEPGTGNPTAGALAAWHDVNGPEDLALWSETSTSSSMAGGGIFQVRGVFMAPNAAPFEIKGGGVQDLTNAQYIASSISLSGNGATLKMSVDPNSAVTVPDQGLVGLVR